MAYNITITPYDGDSTAEFISLPGIATDTIATRTSRSALVGGGSYIDHRGFSQGDRTISISYPLDQSTYEKLIILADEEYLYLITHEAAFIGSIASFNQSGSQINISFLVESQASS